MHTHSPHLSLASALSRQDIDQVNMALQSGGDPNALGGQGLAALGMLAQSAPLPQTAAIMALLVQHGADLDAVDRRGRTALITAARTGYVDNVHTLLDLGADPWRRDAEQLSALAWAMDGMNVDCAALLARRAGWDTQFTSKEGLGLAQFIRSRYTGAKIDAMMLAIEAALAERDADLLAQATIQATSEYSPRWRL